MQDILLPIFTYMCFQSIFAKFTYMHTQGILGYEKLHTCIFKVFLLPKITYMNIQGIFATKTLHFMHIQGIFATKNYIHAYPRYLLPKITYTHIQVFLLPKLYFMHIDVSSFSSIS